MAGLLLSKIDQGHINLWRFDTVPTDNGISIGVQVGDLVYETTGSHLYVIDSSHAKLAMSA